MADSSKIMYKFNTMNIKISTSVFEPWYNDAKFYLKNKTWWGGHKSLLHKNVNIKIRSQEEHLAYQTLKLIRKLLDSNQQNIFAEFVVKLKEQNTKPRNKLKIK